MKKGCCDSLPSVSGVRFINSSMNTSEAGLVDIWSVAQVKCWSQEKVSNVTDKLICFFFFLSDDVLIWDTPSRRNGSLPSTQNHIRNVCKSFIKTEAWKSRSFCKLKGDISNMTDILIFTNWISKWPPLFALSHFIIQMESWLLWWWFEASLMANAATC